MIAALFVETGGSYYGLDGVDPWDETRDARLYDGPFPVVVHSPCQRWGRLWAGQPLWIKRTGERKIKGDDGGCFASGLANARKYGGKDNKHRIGTPPEFRDLLIGIARSATFPGIAAAMADQCGQAGRPGEMRAK